jgi:hypothetical protein
MKFRALLELHGKTATGITVPPEVVESLGGGKRPAVTVTLKKHSYRTTIAFMGGQFLIPVSAEHREAAGVKAGDHLDVGVELDAAPREVDVPADLAAALKKAGARTAFDALSFTRRKEAVVSVEGAKKPETRERRIEKIVTDLAG